MSSTTTSDKHRNKIFKPILISIEGNIGAGKTTLLENLRMRRPDWTFINEPVDSWSKIRNEKDQSILEVFYEDRKRWSYTFQNCALLTRYQEIEAAITAARVSFASGENDVNYCTNPKVFFTERCLDTDYHVFTKMLKADGSLNSIELQLYERLLKQLKSTATPLSAIVHVNTSPVVCMDRIKSRGRAGEDAISLGYLKALDYYQSEWISKSSVPYIATDLCDMSQVETFIHDLLLIKGEEEKLDDDDEEQQQQQQQVNNEREEADILKSLKEKEVERKVSVEAVR
eukprot:gene24128-32545_t